MLNIQPKTISLPAALQIVYVDRSINASSKQTTVYRIDYGINFQLDNVAQHKFSTSHR